METTLGTGRCRPSADQHAAGAAEHVAAGAAVHVAAGAASAAAGTNGRRGPAAHVHVASTLAMAEGIENNPWSYHRNSSVQAYLFNVARPVFDEEIEKMSVGAQLPAAGLLCLADLGCSSGLNTISNMTAVYDDVSRRYAASGCSVPPAMAFFSDLPSNDFNSLFRLLAPPDSLKLAAAADAAASIASPTSESTKSLWNRPGLVAAGVPGTFYNSLFPDKMLHVVMAIFAVHWISEIPAPLRDPGSGAFNRGGIWLPGSGSPEVEREYAKQFVKDLSRFLVLRADEVVPGGLLLLELAAKQEAKGAKPDWFPPFGEVLEDAWNELVEEGKLDAADRDGFNMPLYFPTLDEVKEAVEDANRRIQGGSDRWEIKRLEYRDQLNPYGPLNDLRADAHSFAAAGCRKIRSVVSSLVQRQIGAAQTDALFCKMDAIAGQRAHELVDRLHHAVIVAVLTCKPSRDVAVLNHL